jgi:hypothetical protein
MRVAMLAKKPAHVLVSNGFAGDLRECARDVPVRQPLGEFDDEQAERLRGLTAAQRESSVERMKACGFIPDPVAADPHPAEEGGNPSGFPSLAHAT